MKGLEKTNYIVMMTIPVGMIIDRIVTRLMSNSNPLL